MRRRRWPPPAHDGGTAHCGRSGGERAGSSADDCRWSGRRVGIGVTSDGDGSPSVAARCRAASTPLRGRVKHACRNTACAPTKHRYCTWIVCRVWCSLMHSSITVAFVGFSGRVGFLSLWGHRRRFFRCCHKHQPCRKTPRLEKHLIQPVLSELGAVLPRLTWNLTPYLIAKLSEKYPKLQEPAAIPARPRHGRSIPRNLQPETAGCVPGGSTMVVDAGSASRRPLRGKNPPRSCSSCCTRACSRAGHGRGSGAGGD